MLMEIEFDPEKNARNVRDRGISFDQAQEFDWDSALVWSDTRQDYGEERFIALGLIGERLHSLVFTVRGNTVRVINLRKANRREELVLRQGCIDGFSWPVRVQGNWQNPPRHCVSVHLTVF